MRFRDEDIAAIGVRTVDGGTVDGLLVIAPVTVATKAGGAVHALLCRRPHANETYRLAVDRPQDVDVPGLGVRYLVYYDRSTDRMVAHSVKLTELGGWLRRLGV